MTLIERFYRAEADQPPRLRPRMRWRLSPDIVAALDLADTRGDLRRGSLIMGYQVVVDDTLPPDSIRVEQTPIGVNAADLTFTDNPRDSVAELVTELRRLNDGLEYDRAIARWQRGEGRHPGD